MYRRNSRQRPSKNLTFFGMIIDHLVWVVPLLLAGGLFLLDLWRLAVYPATICVLALLWVALKPVGRGGGHGVHDNLCDACNAFSSMVDFYFKLQSQPAYSMGSKYAGHHGARIRFLFNL